jgi:hypothetical protein
LKDLREALVFGTRKSSKMASWKIRSAMVDLVGKRENHL